MHVCWSVCKCACVAVSVYVCSGLGVAFKCCRGLAKGASNDARTMIALTLFACGRSFLSAGGCAAVCACLYMYRCVCAFSAVCV